MSKEIQNNPTVEYAVDSDGITHGVIDKADVVPAHSSDGEDSNKNITYCGLEKDQNSKDGQCADINTDVTDIADEVCNLQQKDQKNSKDVPPADVAMNITYCVLENDQTSKDGPPVDVDAMNITGLEKDQTSNDSLPVDVAAMNITELEKDQTSNDSLPADVDAMNSADGLYCSACNSQFASTFLYTLHMKHHEFQDNIQGSPDSDVERTTSIKEDPGMADCEVADMTVNIPAEINSNSRTDNPCDETYVKYTNQTSLQEKTTNQTTPCCHDNIVEASKSSNSSNSEIGNNFPSLFKCKCCGKCFKAVDTFVKTHKKSNVVEGDDTVSSDDAGMFKCTKCRFSFTSREQLKRHKYRHVFPNRSNLTPVDTDVNSRSLVTFACYICGNTFNYHRDLSVHKKGHFQQKPAVTSMEVCDDVQTRSQTGGRAALEVVKLDTPVLLQYAKTNKMEDIDAQLLQDKIIKMADKNAKFSQHAERTKMADIDTNVFQDKKSKTAEKDEKLLQHETKYMVLLQDDKITKTAKKNAVSLQVKLTKLSDKNVTLIQNRNTKMADKDVVILQEDGRSKKVDNKVKHSDNIDNVGSSVAGFNPRDYCLINEAQFLVGLHQKDDKEQHRCRLCERVFTTRVGLNVHMLSHSDEKPFVCPICGERFVLGVHLYVHKRKHTAICAKSRGHSKGGSSRKNFKPDIKGKIETKKCFSFYHSSVNNILRCECGRSFANKSNLERHRELHKNPGSKMFNSDKNSSDNRVRNFICSLCKRTFISRNNLLSHKMTRHGQKHRNADQLKNRKTSTCSKNTEQLRNRKTSKCSKNTDRLSSRDPRSFKLECLCGKRFRDRWFMDRHTAICKYLSSRGIKSYVTTQTSFWKTTTTTTTTEAVSTAGVVETRTFRRCGLCEKVVATKQLYKVHVARHWNPKSKLFISTVDPSLLKRQISILDSGGTTCVFCGKRSLSTVSAVNHLKVHIGMKPFACGECGCRYTWKENLRRHVRVKHQQKCSLDTYRKLYTHVGMSKDSYRKSSPNQRCKTGSEHAKINHRKESGGNNFNGKKHLCKVCKKTFLDSNSLKVHSKKHNSLKPLKCLECGKLFKSRRGKSSHMLNFHGSLSSECKDVKSILTYDLEASRKSEPVSVASGRLPDYDAVEKLDESKHLLCVVCDRVFRFERLLDAHMLTHTGELPWPCRLCDKRYTTFSHLARHVTSIHRETYQRYTRDQHSHLVKFMGDPSHGGY